MLNIHALMQIMVVKNVLDIILVYQQMIQIILIVVQVKYVHIVIKGFNNINGKLSVIKENDTSLHCTGKVYRKNCLAPLGSKSSIVQSGGCDAHSKHAL